MFTPYALLALYAVKVRAETMQKASELVPSGMLSVIGRPQAQYNYACLQAKEHCKSLGMENPVCSVANYLFPDGRVIAGNQQVIPSYVLAALIYHESTVSSFLSSLSHQKVVRAALVISAVFFVFPGSGFPPGKLSAPKVHADQTSPS